MCLITKKQEPKIAKEDIKVYKVLKEDRTTIYQRGFKYEHGETYKTTMKFVPNDAPWPFWNSKIALKLDKQFPGWFSNKYSNGIRENMICVAQGYHAFENKEDAIKHVNNSIHCQYTTEWFEFIIPKGAEYFTDGFGLIVSNQIKML